MKLLVIGSEGFIGKHCVAYFSNAGHSVFEADIIQQEKKNYFWLSKTNSDFAPLFSGQEYDVCINASGSAHVGFSFDNPAADFELNVVNVHKLLVAIRTSCPACRFINFSSAAVYGNPVGLPVQEDMQPAPLSPYGFHKLQSEYLVREYHRFFGLATCSLRIFSVYGPGLRKQLFWDIYQKTRNGKAIELFGTGRESRDFIFINDLVTMLDLVIRHAPFDGASYNVASGHEVTISEAASVFLRLLKPSASVSFNGRVKQGDPVNWVADISTAVSWGFKPQFDLEEGLRITAEWMRQCENQ